MVEETSRQSKSLQSSHLFYSLLWPSVYALTLPTIIPQPSKTAPQSAPKKSTPLLVSLPPTYLFSLCHESKTPCVALLTRMMPPINALFHMALGPACMDSRPPVTAPGVMAFHGYSCRQIHGNAYVQSCIIPVPCSMRKALQRHNVQKRRRAHHFETTHLLSSVENTLHAPLIGKLPFCYSLPTAAKH